MSVIVLSSLEDELYWLCRPRLQRLMSHQLSRMRPASSPLLPKPQAAAAWGPSLGVLLEEWLSLP